MGSLILAIFVGVGSSAAGNAQEVANIDERISIDVEGITLDRLLRLWDEATGLHSSVPPELANQTVSIHFSRLSVSDAVRKIFEQLPVNYVFVEGQGITITLPSEAGAMCEPPPTYEEQPQISEQVTIQETRLPPEPPPPPPPPVQRSWVWFGPPPPYLGPPAYLGGPSGYPPVYLPYPGY